MNDTILSFYIDPSRNGQVNQRGGRNSRIGQRLRGYVIGRGTHHSVIFMAKDEEKQDPSPLHGSGCLFGLLFTANNGKGNPLATSCPNFEQILEGWTDMIDVSKFGYRVLKERV